MLSSGAHFHRGHDASLLEESSLLKKAIRSEAPDWHRCLSLSLPFFTLLDELFLDHIWMTLLTMRSAISFVVIVILSLICTLAAAQK